MKTNFIQCRQAADVVAGLQGWIEDHDNLSTVPSAHLLWSVHCCVVKIGDIQVWNSEENNESDLSFEFCRDQYLSELLDFLPFLNNERK